MDSDKTIQRRDFLGNSSAAAIVGAAALNGAAGGLLASESKDGRLEGANFVDLVGETFSVSGQAAPLKLIDARVDRPRDERPAHVRQEPFSLLFAAPEGTELESSIHAISHRRFGQFEVYMHRVQVESYPQGNTYEICFS
jgi:hypothetical protein